MMTMATRIFLCLMIFVFAAPATPAFASSEGIAAVVNQDIISMTDLTDRLRMVVSSSGLPPTKEIQDKLTAQVLNDLIEEQLKLQEARRLEIEVSDADVEQGFAALAQQNNLTPDQFRAVISQSRINIATIQRQIKSQIGWMKVIQQEMRPQVNVTDTDVDDYISRLSSGKGKSEYNVSEIFLPVSDENPEADTRQLAERLVQEIRSGKAPFAKVAQQFSSSAGATRRGGNLGWVQQGQVEPELDAALGAMQKESISDPVRTTDGYHILFLRDVRVISDETIPSRDQIYTTIGIQRLERMQARTLLDLKTTAFIENRAGT